MSANPLSYQEIEAFDRLERVDLRPWEVEMICRLDDAVLSIWAGNPPQAERAVADPNAGLKAALRAAARRKKKEG